LTQDPRVLDREYRAGHRYGHLLSRCSSRQHAVVRSAIPKSSESAHCVGRRLRQRGRANKGAAALLRSRAAPRGARRRVLDGPNADGGCIFATITPTAPQAMTISGKAVVQPFSPQVLENVVSLHRNTDPNDAVTL
jgi:hypothetical protein